MVLSQIKKENMLEKNISIYFFIIGTILLIYGIEQLFGYLLFQIPINLSWWIGFISIIFGICLLFRGIKLYNKNNKKNIK